LAQGKKPKEEWLDGRNVPKGRRKAKELFFANIKKPFLNKKSHSILSKMAKYNPETRNLTKNDDNLLTQSDYDSVRQSPPVNAVGEILVGQNLERPKGNKACKTG
jgi:NAD-dependent SIR2 family protein deacetylase